MTISQNLADKITTFFEKYDMMCGTTFEEMFMAIWRALENHDEKQIQIIKDYFRDIRWANSKAQEIYRVLDVYYS